MTTTATAAATVGRNHDDEESIEDFHDCKLSFLKPAATDILQNNSSNDFNGNKDYIKDFDDCSKDEKLK
eukprot:5419019-Ditylum_brightwellii.AAC.1